MAPSQPTESPSASRAVEVAPGSPGKPAPHKLVSFKPSMDALSAWTGQVRYAIRSVAELREFFKLTPDEVAGAERAERSGFPLAITPYYAALADRDDPLCPIRRQCVPTWGESLSSAGDLRDPLGEEQNTVGPRLIQRYPDRLLFLVHDRCSVYCRFCTRSRIVGQGDGFIKDDDLDTAIAYVRSHPDIKDVIVSGGDPLVANTSKIISLLQSLRSISHLDSIRIASRTPVTLPQRFDDELTDALEKLVSGDGPAIWLMTHFNHPKELTDESSSALRRISNVGVPILNQTVLLKGINDSAETLETLFRGLVRRRVKPYYLLQMDPVSGTGHLRTPLQTGMDLMASLQGRVSGIALPKFIVDTPGGRGKVHLAPNTIVETGANETTLRTFRGEHVKYIDV